MSIKNLARYFALAFAICIGFLLVFPGEADARSRHRPKGKSHPVHRKHYHPPVIKLDPTKFEEIKCAAMNAYFESDDNLEEMFESQFMIAFVTKHRADEARADEAMRLPFVGDFAQNLETLRKHSVCMATYKRWQFSWTMTPVCKWCQKWIRLQDVPRVKEFHEYKWELAQYAAQVVMEGWAPKDLGLDPSLSRATFYFNPDATRHKIACEFFYKPLVRLAEGERIGGHVFFAFPTPEEKTKLAEARAEAEKKALAEAQKNPPKKKGRRGRVQPDLLKSCAPVDAIPVLVWKNPAT